MTAASHPVRSYLKALRRAAPRLLRALDAELGLRRVAAAEAYAATSAIVLAALARHTRRRPNAPWAAVSVVAKYGRPSDLDAPELGLKSRLERADLSPRLGGLLGDAGPALARWLAERHGGKAATMERAVAATAAIALGALSRGLSSQELADWVAVLPDDALTRPEAVAEPPGDLAEVFLGLRRRGRAWPVRVLGLDG